MGLKVDEMRALELIRSLGKRGQTMLAGDALINANIKALLAAGMVEYDGGRWSGFALTAKGKGALDARTVTP